MKQPPSGHPANDRDADNTEERVWIVEEDEELPGFEPPAPPAETPPPKNAEVYKHVHEARTSLFLATDRAPAQDHGIIWKILRQHEAFRISLRDRR